MVLNPDVQSRAQAEVDSVVGKDRLPEFDDLPSLPYVEAIIMELLRWHPVVPFGVFLSMAINGPRVMDNSSHATCGNRG